ncbi:MAG TPA: hypothetical protein VGS41_02980 [Chthonomonadales bacterium]|nr:hypothetical protein [Chthonomonadales bacterium]
MRGVGNRWIIYGFWTVVCVVFLAALILPGWLRIAIRADRAGARPQSGTATVAILEPQSTDVSGQTSPAQVDVRFRGRIIPAKEIVHFEALRLNGPAHIIYRIGKSGRIYVDSVQPCF